MADDIDRAGERIDAEMRARLQVLPTFNVVSLTECSDCGDEIPKRRQLIGAVKRCIDCQNNFEGRR